MNHSDRGFNEALALHELRHYLPSQAPLKDFVHHNSLHAFQQMEFHEALRSASAIFGYQTYLSPAEYRQKYRNGEITEAALDSVLEEYAPDSAADWKYALLYDRAEADTPPRIGRLRAHWKLDRKVNLDKEVHPLLFRITGAYLDQGVAIWPFPFRAESFLSAVRQLEKASYRSLYRHAETRALLFREDLNIKDLLARLVSKEEDYLTYLFDQQFAHPGWSGLVAQLEINPQGLLDRRPVSLHDWILLELLLEIDVLNLKFKGNWEPLSAPGLIPLFAPVEETRELKLLRLWQTALERSFHDQVLNGLLVRTKTRTPEKPALQALFCIDDRECSFRRYVEQEQPDAATYGTAGFFQVEFFFRPEHGKFITKCCPAPVTPEYLIREVESGFRHRKDVHFHRHTHGIFGGWLSTQVLGIWAALRLAANIIRPSASPIMVSSFKHMDPEGKLLYHRENSEERKEDLLHGFTVEEMAQRMEALLRSIGLVDNFAPFIYIIGHGASSINNTYYAGYDCGACSGRAGSVNARLGAAMLNNPAVRAELEKRGICIPESTRAIGALHDTTCDEMEFYDFSGLAGERRLVFEEHKRMFHRALRLNARERSRRFAHTRTEGAPERVHREVKKRSYTLFEPRPEWNHATNALCLVGRRETSRHLFLDRRAFLNSYDYRLDPEGTLLLNTLKAVAPVCGGINLEYYFSRVDNHRLGAGSKLPHNVAGLFGVANGMDGDLRTGLPLQMVNIHDPLRLLTVVEQQPEIIQKVLESHPPTMEWFANGWVLLVAQDPETGELFRFSGSCFEPFRPVPEDLPVARSQEELVLSGSGNLPVHLLTPAGHA